MSKRKWWSALTNEVDPISLDLISSLPTEPFRLGKCYFAAELLASYLLSTSNFSNPTTREPLSRQDCVRLDALLADTGRRSNLSVTRAYDLFSSTASVVRVQHEQREALRREAVAVFQQLFSFSRTRATRGQAELRGLRVVDHDDNGEAQRARLDVLDERDFPLLERSPAPNSRPKPLPAPTRRGSAGGVGGGAGVRKHAGQAPPPRLEVRPTSGWLAEPGVVAREQDVVAEWVLPASEDMSVTMSSLVMLDPETGTSSVLCATPGTQWSIPGQSLLPGRMYEFVVQAESLLGELRPSNSVFLTVKDRSDVELFALAMDEELMQSDAEDCVPEFFPHPAAAAGGGDVAVEPDGGELPRHSFRPIHTTPAIAGDCTPPPLASDGSTREEEEVARPRDIPLWFIAMLVGVLASVAIVFLRDPQ